MDAPELAITEDESKQFLKAAQNVMRHYSVQTTQKTLDWIALVGVTTAIYAPRFAAIAFRRAKKDSRATARHNVVPLHGGIHLGDPDGIPAE
jgi:hypothetical protein